MCTGGTPPDGDISKTREEQAGEEGSEATTNQPSSPQFSACDARADSDGNRQGFGGLEREGGDE